jgi:glyoxalase family protein
MDQPLLGLHHVTAIAGNPQGNVDFYTEVLGQRLVKLTVNFDNPGTYHLYYGDEAGHPGTILTFFPWPHLRKGGRGSGQPTSTAYSIPAGSAGYWIERLKQFGIPYDKPYERFNEEVLALYDPDGLQLELVANENASPDRAWRRGTVPPEHALRGFYSITLTEKNLDPTASILGDVMGFRCAGETNNRCRFEVGEGADKARIDLLFMPDAPTGFESVGTVHHIAYRTPDDAQQAAWQTHLLGHGLNVTRVMDRQYFRSIYFREPGGVLFEIATDPPGFTFDEKIEELGSALKLPPWLEPRRAQIQAELPTLQL